MTTDLIKSTIRTLVPREIRNWLRSPSKSAGWISDSLAFRLGKKKLLKLSPEWELACHPRAYKVFQEAQIHDAEQREEFQEFLSCCGTSMRLFDIGAHFGIFSLAAAHFGGSAVAVDPSPTAAQMIATHAAMNGYGERIRIVQAAVGESVGFVNMLTAGVFTDGYFRVEKRPRPDLKKVASTTIDDISNKFGPPTHVKIDVEGHELAVLRGARKTLSQSSPVLFLELHNQMVTSQGGNPSVILDELCSLGYPEISHQGELIERAPLLEKPLARVVASRSSARRENNARAAGREG